jgi:MerR family transcriptional regulator, light-induced transcriptional regulator
METRYPIRAVAKMTGISLDTLRAWERRYKAVVPERSNRGRQYGTADIERLRVLSQLVQKGHAIGGIAALTDAELGRLLLEPGNRPLPEAAEKDLIRPVMAAIDAFDASAAGEELNRLAATLAPRQLVYDVVVPMMRTVGERWHSGDLSIAQEHLVTQTLRNLLGSMIRLFQSATANGNSIPRIVFATPAGESHEFGILSSAMLAAMNGLRLVYLGPDLPAREIVEAARRVSARAVVLGVTVMNASTEDEVRNLARQLPENTSFWIGGSSGAGAELHISSLAPQAVVLRDLQGFENQCQMLRY